MGGGVVNGDRIASESGDEGLSAVSVVATYQDESGSGAFPAKISLADDTSM